MAADRDWSNDWRWQDSRRYGTSYNSSSSASSSAAASSAAPVRRATKAEGCIHPYGPPKVEPEDSWTPPNGGPRQVRCHQCDRWEQWQYVVEKGAIEGNPVLGDLECWRCYIQRTDSTQKWGDVKPLFTNLTVKKRNDRVERYQNLLAYVKIPEYDGAKSRIVARKHAFDDLSSEGLAFEASGGGASSTSPLDNDGDVTFLPKDQYFGVNEVVYKGEDVVLFNWASNSKAGTNVAMSTLVRANKETITRGRSLEGNIAAHNLCVVSEPRAITELQQLFDPDRQKNYIAYGIGGEYRDPTDPRGRSSHYNGIKVMGMTSCMPNNLWSMLEWKELHRLLKGNHEGAVEGRKKCIRKADQVGIAEFDGQSALTYFKGRFFVYARSNPRERGFRTVQVCHGPLNDLSPFQLCKFKGVPDASDIYFLHPYVVPNGDRLIAIMSLVWAEGWAPPLGKHEPGIYLAASRDGLSFLPPVLLHACKSHERRAYDLPAQGGVTFEERGISFYVHSNVPCRMPPKDRNREERLVKVSKEVPPYVSKLWNEQ